MKKIRLTEKDLTRIIKQVLNEQPLKDLEKNSNKRMSLAAYLKELLKAKEVASWSDEKTKTFVLNVIDNHFEYKDRNIKEYVIQRRLKRFINEDDESLFKKMLRKLKGVSEKQLEYNMKNDLPWDWKGSKEGFYEKMEPRKKSSGSN